MTDITSLSANQYQYCPNLTTNTASGTRGRKFCSELSTITDAGQEAMDCMLIRLAEIYLIYAEATCELGNGTISDEDLDKSLNLVRARGGVAPLNAALIAKARTLGCDMSYLERSVVNVLWSCMLKAYVLRMYVVGELRNKSLGQKNVGSI